MLTILVSEELKLALINAVNSIYNECYEENELTQLYLHKDYADLYFGINYYTIHYTLEY